MKSSSVSGGTGWLSYEPIAEIYARLLVPIFFARPSAGLVDALCLTIGDRVLDVGTGPGVTAVLAEHSVGPDGLVVGIDPSLSMLHQARLRGLLRVVLGGLPQLPFADSTFDAVMASFVLPNLVDYRAGLSDMTRVLKPGGRLGVTAWGAGTDEFAKLWTEVSARFVPLQQLQETKTIELPWQEYFNHGANLKQALTDAGLTAVSVSERVYPISMQQDEYLLARQSLAEGRLLRHVLGETQWEEFCQAVSEQFRKQFGQCIEYDRSAFFGIAKKPLGQYSDDGHG